MKYYLIYFLLISLLAPLRLAADSLQSIEELAIWEAAGIQELDTLPQREMAVKLALEDKTLSRLVEIAPRSAIYSKAEEFLHTDELLTIIKDLWLETFAESCEQKIAIGKMDIRDLAREMMVDALRTACRPKSDNPGAISTVRAELRTSYKERLKEDPIRWVSEYAKTMGSIHDRLFLLNKHVSAPPSSVPSHGLTSLRASVVTALFENGNGQDWASPGGLKILKKIIETDNNLGFTWVIDYLATRQEFVPTILSATIEKKIIVNYVNLQQEAKDSAVKFVRGLDYDRSSIMLKSMAASEVRPEVKAEIFGLVLMKAGNEGVGWIYEMFPSSAHEDMLKLIKGINLTNEERIASIKRLVSLNDQFVIELLARVSLSKKWLNNDIIGEFIGSNSEFSSSLASAIAAEVSWDKSNGRDVLAKALETDMKEIRKALFESAEKSNSEALVAYGEMIATSLTGKNSSKYDAEEIVALINISIENPKTGELIVDFLDENSSIYDDRFRHESALIFKHALYASGEIAGTAPKVKDVILEGLSDVNTAGRQVASVHALNSWPAGLALDEGIINGLRATLMKDGDLFVDAHRLDRMVDLGGDPDQIISLKFEIIDLLKTRPSEIFFFKEELEALLRKPPVTEKFTGRSTSFEINNLLK